MKKETELWIKIAQEDLKSAKILFEKSIYRMTCYHSQQFVEKIFKAILTENNVEFAKTHNLIDLKNAVSTLGYNPPLKEEEAVFLNSIYRARYPADMGLLPSGEPTEKDAKQALRIANKIKKWFDRIKL